MIANPKLKLLMQKMFDDEKTLKKIMEIDSMEELYRLCLTIQDGYTLEEFMDFFEKLVRNCQEETKSIDKLEDSDLKNISGGVNRFNRVTASVLAALTVLTPGNCRATAETSSALTDGVAVLRPIEEGEKEAADKEAIELDTLEYNEQAVLRPISAEISEEQQGFGARIKNFFSKAADWVWDHKGTIFVAAVALLTLGGLLISESGKIGDNFSAWKNNKKEIDKLKLEKLNLAHGAANNKDTKDSIEAIEAKIKVLEEVSPSETLTKDLKIAGVVAGGLSGIWNLIKLGYGKFKDFAEIVQVVSAMYWGVSGNLEMYRALKNKIELSWKVNMSDFDYNDGGQRLDGLFKEFIHGQESAKRQLKIFYNIFSNALEDEKQGVASPQQLAPQILILNGPSGTGKTYMAQLLTQCLTDIDPFFISAGAILKDAEQYYDGNVGYAFFAGGQRLGAGSKDAGTSYNNLSSYLSTTAGSVRVVIVDEYDKLYTKSNAGVYPEKHPLDETFRDILMNNVNDPYTMERLDLSKTIFICTTNETKASLQGRIVSFGKKLYEKEVDENGNLVFDEDGLQSYIEPKLDGTGTQTLVPHDGSFVQRIAGQTCYFDSLTHKDYVRITHDALDDIATITNIDELKKLKDTNKVILKSRIHYKFAEMVIDPEGYELIANYAESMQSGARAIVGAGGNAAGSVAGNLTGAIINQCSRWLGEGYSVKNMKIKAIPRETVNESGLRVIEFDIRCMGYAD